MPLAQRGYALDCIELGAALAEVAHEKLAPYPKTRVLQADFDTVALAPAAYDLVVAATAFHWLDPETRFNRAQRLLKARGALALFWHRPVVTEISRDFVDAVQRVYQDIAPRTDAPLPLAARPGQSRHRIQPAHTRQRML